jgi:hypothetical protein
MAEALHRGSCHCGAVRFEATLDLSAGTGRCNCRLCLKTRQWGAMTKPSAVSVTQGEEALARYEVGNGVGSHRFCKGCGVRLFATGHLEQLGGDFAVVFVNTLDDLSEGEFAAIPIVYADGSRDNWWVEPAIKGHL